ncbi:uncharacterized protein LOC142329866 [Lycorma delicatula]|uniref:uncharacterized protein LOC142329866 n=1 Tax=Lycorma delicatula TaxID=130591 RepID=UPI003F5146B9
MGITRLWISIFLTILLITLVSSNDDKTVKKRAGVKEDEEKTGETKHHKTEDNINNDTIKPSHNEINKNATKRFNSGRKITPVNNNLKKGKKNAELLHKIGMAKIKTPMINHHRKRLASQSRKAQPGDSHMFVIKLPPNPYYYAHSKPVSPQFNDVQNLKSQPQLPSGASFNKIGLDFSSNGKPSRIYHWNIPVMKKMMIARKTNGNSKKELLWDPISEQSTIDSHDNDKDDFLHHKVSYYRPRRPGKKTFHKYFPGNGKPHSLYVIEKSKKPVSYHRLLP